MREETKPFLIVAKLTPNSTSTHTDRQSPMQLQLKNIKITIIPSGRRKYMANVCMRMTMRICTAMKSLYNATDCQKGGTTHSNLVCLYPANLHPHLYFCSSVCSRTFFVTSTCFCSFFKVSLDDHGHLVHFDHTKTLNLIMLYLIPYSNICEFTHLLTDSDSFLMQLYITTCLSCSIQRTLYKEVISPGSHILKELKLQWRSFTLRPRLSSRLCPSI